MRRVLLLTIGVSVFTSASMARTQAPTPAACADPASRASSTAPLPEWRPTLPHGQRELALSTRVTWPAGVSAVGVQLWGGGGGGGGGSRDTFAESGAGGGGGASGGYARASIAVSAGKTYVFVIGQGGDGGAVAAAGQPGSSSAFCDGPTVLLDAPGGGAGEGAKTDEHGGQGGRAQADPSDQTDATPVRRRGEDGMSGSLPLFEYAGFGGRGGRPVTGSIRPEGSFGGGGGKGEMRPAPASPGAAGGHGSALVSW